MSSNLLYVGCSKNGQTMFGYDDSQGYPIKCEACECSGDAGSLPDCSELPASLNPGGAQPCPSCVNTSCTPNGGNGPQPGPQPQPQPGPQPGPQPQPGPRPSPLGGPQQQTSSSSFLEKPEGKATATIASILVPLGLAWLLLVIMRMK